MIKVIIGFTKGVMSMAKPWRAWTVLLLATNLVGPIFFIGNVEAKIVLGVVLISATILMALFAKLGYVRLLGIGHILWVPMIPWLWSRLDQIGTESLFGKWLLMVIVIDSISVVIDAIDVLRYIRGERTPSVTMGE